ncbi:chromosome partitioning protein ParA [Cryptosporangium phraense]|uniref:Chromosome partitioning protein ParA n=1 Tax=Cryptosporangium phraense TaxID=2593070 RepID=A0A545AHW1_9ACTN|nr:chromosome partitioning protein ParA [Cryptosporangium phraense]TQS40914.1 chromosome partitioning protein ParA [Cryptosporangium phraense]
MTRPVDHLDVVGDRVAIGIQLIGISRLSTHPVPLVPGCLITVAGQGPKDSNGAGKSSFIAALTLLHGDEQWRLASGARESADLLFSAEIAAQDREYASADHGYVVGVFADADAEHPADSALTVWLRIDRETPHLLVRWTEGLHVPTASTEAERERQADGLWAALPPRAGRRDYNARDLSRVLFGEHIRCVSFLSTSVRPSATANLLAQPLNELKPDRIFSAVAALTGLDHEIADEQRHRNTEHAELEKAADAERKLLEWEEQASAIESGIERREQARDREADARGRWRSRAAVLVARASDELEAIDDDLGRIAADDAAHQERLASIADELHVLGDDVALRDRLRRAEAAFASLDGDHQQLRDRRRGLTASLDRLGREADELDATARDADGRSADVAASELEVAVDARTAAIGARAIASQAVASASAAVRVAEAGDDVATAQLSALREAGIPAVALVDAVTLTEEQRPVWEPLLWPFREAVVVDASQVDRATGELAAVPGSMLVAAAGAAGSAADGLPAVAGAFDLAGFLGALRAGAVVDGAAVTVAGATVIGGFDAPITGRAARIDRARTALTTASTALDVAADRLTDADRAVAIAERRLTAARAAVTAESKRHRIQSARRELDEVAEREDALAPRLSAARHEYDLARLAETGRQQQADALHGNRRRVEDAREVLRVERDRLDTRRRVIDLDTLLRAWGNTIDAAHDHLADLPDDEQLFDEDDWWRAAEAVLAEMLALCFRPDDPVPAQVEALADERATPGRGQADKQKQTFPALLDAVRDHLTLTAHEDAHQRARLSDERVEKRRARDAAAIGHEEAAKAAAAVRASLARAITARLNAVGSKFDDLDRAYGGYGAGLRFTEPEPPADPTKRWNWEVTPVWRRAEGNALVAYDRRGNTAQMDEKAVKLVCAAALASGTGRPLLLVLDELGRNLGKQHRREAVALFERIGADSGITVVGALQDDMERYAIDACGEYVKLRRTSDTMAYNQAPVIHGFDTRAGRVALLSEWLSGSYLPV